MACFAAMLCAAWTNAAMAGEFRYASFTDIPTLDPHNPYSRYAPVIVRDIHEPLIALRADNGLAPSLALRWYRVHPQAWRFELRQDVQFHDGSPFTADDVVFSYHRALAADVRGDLFRGVINAYRVDPYTVDFVTETAQPTLPRSLLHLLIVDRDWALAQDLTRASASADPGDPGNLNVNGTGPFRLHSRVPGQRTVLLPNTDWWGEPEHNVTAAIFQQIADDAARAEALLRGEVDMIFPVPVEQVPVLRGTGDIRVERAPELRTLFLGMDQWRKELRELRGTDLNPFRDRKVRLAIYQAIDVGSLQRQIGLDLAVPAGTLIPPGVNGYSPEMSDRHAYDPQRARKLLVEAGYPRGFPVTLDCPNDRYVNDAALCRGIADMLRAIGLDVALALRGAEDHFARLVPENGRNTSLYLLGWSALSLDAMEVLENLMTLHAGPRSGRWNAGRYSNPEVEALVRAAKAESDATKRFRKMRQALLLHQADIGHIPLYHQSHVWALGPRVRAARQNLMGQIDLRAVRIKDGQGVSQLLPPNTSASEPATQVQ